ncbi:ABC transporter permease [Sneathiella litorea]|uniref:ABC transporter permease subunit n=1 Tax=Sneathiella litorea TaxID=2606216 RepID=A0A6L8W927_9PROT|nr:ABC transporter permease [Sneathiella litorea]MZR31605.1 ABC transporter permease subunit [Sneathiella litorea]
MSETSKPTQQPQPVAKPKRSVNTTLIWQLVILVVLLGSWEVMSGRLFDSFWVSKPSLIVSYIYNWVLNGDFMRHLTATMTEIIVGYSLGAGLGLALGLPIGRMERTAKILDPFLLALNGIPRVALAPLFVIWFGIGITPKIVLVFTLVFFVVFYNSYAGVRSVERRYVDLAWVMGARSFRLFSKVILPAAMPYIILGLKLSIPYAVIGAIIGEFIASSEGLGYKIQLETSIYNTTGTMGGIIVLMILVVLLNSILAWIERRALAWRPPSRSSDAGGQGL